LLNIFVSGRIQDYLEFYAKEKSFIESSGVKHEKNIAKMRLLTFLQIAESQKELTFDAVEKQMQIQADDIESFIIEGKYFLFTFQIESISVLAVRTKTIRCKIDHLARKVVIDSTAQRTFTKQHWVTLKDKLEAWKTNLTLIHGNLNALITSKTA
jgi:translation initiation factor 3 subunit M